MLFAEIVDVLPDGNRLAKFTYDGVFFELLDKIGEMPLPHYITEKLEDNDRYQTVYARERGSAAPRPPDCILRQSSLTPCAKRV